MAQYYFLDSSNTQHGPVDESQLTANGVTAATMVWCAGMNDWKPAGEVADLAYIFRPMAQGGYNPNANAGYYSAPQQPGGNVPVYPPSSNLVWAILSTILCCLPLGIVSIVYAAQVDSEWARGNYQEAYRKSRLARNWAIASACSGLVVSIIYMACVFLGAFAGAIGL
ncbi:MAG: CD225/dispanin family protein [Muribaculaceae bacterium]|nr:CD225/dispanin family protein [Muribaculaceae bacterium]MDE6645155.1 CD225/dispanin family protein [Muribaculaceae bacterium]